MTTENPKSLFGWKRSCVVQSIGWLSVLAALFSVWVAVQLRPEDGQRLSTWGYALLAFWAVAPPVWFLAEYSFWPPSPGPEDERTKHLHDLARNIWLAVVVVLAMIMGVKWPLD